MELRSRPDLRDVPTAVCGDPTSRHGIILAKNEPAKKYGIQTAETIFFFFRPELAEGFRECDFGILEGKTHEELLGDPAYDAFIGTEGADTFPGGESIPAFNARCLETLRETVETSRQRGYRSIACCVHGGVIMAVLSQVIEGSSYYGWNVENGEGYILEIDETKWKEGQLDGTVTCGIDHRIYT